MARRAYDDFEREMMRNPRDRDPREMQREQDPWDRLDGQEHRRINPQDPDRMDYTRYSRPGPQTTTRSSTSPPVDLYARQIDRGDLSPRVYMDDSRERQRPSIDLQSERREAPSCYQNYFLPGEDINYEVIQFDICRYLGNGATVRPYNHPDGRRGFLITACRALTTAMIQTLKQDSIRYERDAQRRWRIGLPGKYGQEVQATRSPDSSPGVPYGSSATLDDREGMDRPDVPQPGYAGYSMDTTIPTRGYREQEPRMDARMDARQQPATNQHTQVPSISQAYSRDPDYPSPYEVQPQPVSSGPSSEATQPRTLGPNNPPSPPMGRGGQRSDALTIVAAIVGGTAIGAFGVRARDGANLRAALSGR